MLEKITSPARVRHWTGNIPVEYVYTVGVAGEAFLRTLKDRGMLLSSRCPECETSYLPARLYCERCLTKTEDYQELAPSGVVHAFTAAHINVEQAPLPTPQLYAFVTFPGTSGGLVHRLGEVEPPQVHIGMEVEGVLMGDDERTGSINDIRYFRPVT